MLRLTLFLLFFSLSLFGETYGDASGSKKIEGTSGHDTIIAGDGWREISTGNGNDDVTAGDGDGKDSKIETGNGNDDIRAGDGWKEISTDTGNDDVQIGDGTDDSKIETGSGNDNIRAGDNWKEISTDTGNDDVQMGNGADGSKIEVGTGNDDVKAGNNWREVSLDSGNDVVEIGHGNGKDSTIDLSAGNDKITVCGSYWKEIDGGSGKDTLTFYKSESEYSVNGSKYLDKATNYEIELKNIEKVLFSGSCSFVIDPYSGSSSSSTSSTSIPTETYNCIYTSDETKSPTEEECQNSGATISKSGYSVDISEREIDSDFIMTIASDITIEAGEYFYKSFTVNSGVKVSISGDVKIYTKTVHIEKEAEINCDGDPNSLFIYSTDTNLLIKKDTKVSATIFIDGNNLQVTGDASFKGLIVTTDKNSGVDNLNGSGESCGAVVDDEVVEEVVEDSKIEVTDVDTLVRVDSGTTETIDAMFSTGESVNRDIGVIEITNEDSTPGDITYLSYNREVIESFGLTVTEFSENGQIIFSGNSLSNSDWERVFRGVQFVSSENDLNATKKVTFTLKNSDDASNRDLELGNVPPSFEDGNPYNYETKTSLKAEMSQWERDGVHITGYFKGVESPLAVVNRQRSDTQDDKPHGNIKLANYGKIDLSYHESTGFGVKGKQDVADGQIDWKKNTSDKIDGGDAEIMIITFDRPITDVRVGFTGLGGRFTEVQGANAVFEFYYKGVLVRARGKLDREADFDGDGYVSTNIATTNLIVDKILFTILIETSNKSNANYSVRYIVANYTDTKKTFTKSYIVQIVEKTFIKPSGVFEVGSPVRTKRVGDSFDIHFFSVDGDGDPKNYSGTVDVKLLDENLSLIDDLPDVVFRDESSVSKSYILQNIGKSFYISVTNIYGTFYSDIFSVRPDHFEILLAPETPKENEEFTLSILVTDINRNSVAGYNESNSSSLTFSSSLPISGLAEILFKDGVFSQSGLTISGDGDLNISISEIEGEEYAKVDSNDTNWSSRTITSAKFGVELESDYRVHIGDIFEINSSVSTKVVGDTYQLHFLATDRDGIEKSVSVSDSLYIINSDGEVVGELGAVEFDNNSSTIKNLEFTSIGRNFRFVLDTGDENITSDPFAIRPKSFQIVTDPKSIGIDDNFSLSVVTESFSGDIVLGYNETNSTSLQFTSSTPIYNLQDVNFSNGLFFEQNLFASEVGTLEIGISEIEGEEYAKIDENDTGWEERRVGDGNISLTVSDKIPESGSCGLVLNRNGTDGMLYRLEADSPLLGGATQFDISVKFDGDWKRESTLFNYFAGGKDELELYKSVGGELIFYIGGSYRKLLSPADKIFDSKTHTTRFIWRSSTGELKLYLDGNMTETVSNFQKGYRLAEDGVLFFGSEYDEVEQFDSNQLFSGVYRYIKISSEFNSVEWDMEEMDKFGVSNSGYLNYSGQMRWREAKDFCEERGLKLPSKEGVDSLKSYFRENSLSGEYWTDTEIDNDWAYMFRFQNDYGETWTQDMQKVNYKKVFCGGTVSSPLRFVGDIEVENSIDKNCSLELQSLPKQQVGVCGGVSLNSTGYLEIEDPSQPLLSTSYMHSQQLRWADAKNLCEARGMRLPERDELDGSVKDDFRNNSYQGEYWTNSEIDGTWAYMFRFQNNYGETWTQNMQKVNYKSVYCVGDGGDSTSLFGGSDFNISLQILSDGGDSKIIEYINLQLYLENRDLFLEIGETSRAVIEDFPADRNISIHFQFFGESGTVETYVNGELFGVTISKDWKNPTFPNGETLRFGKNFVGEFHYIDLNFGEKRTVWNMNDLNQSHIVDTSQRYTLQSFGDAVPINSECIVTISDKNSSDRNISFKIYDIGKEGENSIGTKVVNSSFSLQISAYDQNGTPATDFSGEVSISLKSGDGEIEITPNFVVLENGTAIENFTVPEITKDGHFEINNSSQSDHFAVRPESFKISVPEEVVAGDNFKIEITTLDNSGRAVSGYSEKNSSSVSFSYKDEKDLSCKTARLGKEGYILSEIAFSDGKYSDTLFYPEIGKVNFSISERVGSEFAKIDRDDTAEGQRLIQPTEAITEFNISKFHINTTMKNMDRNYTYLANELEEMSGKIFYQFKALNSRDEVVENCSNGCYGEDINYTTEFSKVQTGSESVEFSEDVRDELNSTIYKSEFSKGVCKKDGVKINFERKTNRAVNPFSLENITVTVDNFPDSENNSTGKLNFLYGRLVGEQGEQIDDNRIEVNTTYEVYCSEESCKDYSFLEDKKFSDKWWRHGDANRSRFASKVKIEERVDGDVYVDSNNTVVSKIKHKTNREYGINITPPPYLIYDTFDEDAEFSTISIQFPIHEDMREKDVEDESGDILLEKIYIKSDRRVEW
jgi:sporulation protein YlmC with PRC-barrel domain